MYRDGFKNLIIGKTLWKLIIIKLLIMFVVLKGFFFDTTLGTMFETKEEKADFVLENLTKTRE